MAPPLLHLKDIHLTFGGTPLLEGAELVVAPRERLAIVGRNGSGKSTLMRIAAGLVEPDGGERFVQPGTLVRYLPQEPDLAGHATTLAYVEAGLGPHGDAHRARSLLKELGLRGDETPDQLSGGEARRAALARALAANPDILLFDEPTNHLDLPAIEWLEAEIKSLASAVVMISHDRRFLETLSRATLWVDRGLTRRLERGFAAFEAWRDDLLEQEELERHKLDRRIAAETEWLHYGGVTARRKRNQGRLGRLVGLRQERRAQRKVQGNVRMTATEADTSGKLVVEAKDVTKGFGSTPVVRGLSLRVARGDRLGLVGPNGAGKTTILNLLTGALESDAGTIRLGANLEIVTIDQGRELLDPSMSLANALTGGRGDKVTVAGRTKHVVSYMKDFLFAPEQAPTAVGKLSGGERARLMLARALAKPSNLLVLDEPTNDLDLETLDLLEELVADYAGTVLVVSHDRDFLDRVATSVLAFEGDGRWIEYAGGYSDMVAQRGHGVAAKGAAETARGRDRREAQSPASSEPAAEKPRARKLSFKEKHALETLPARIAAIEAEIARMETELAEPALYTRDPKRFAALGPALAVKRSALAAAEDEWLALELLKSEIEGGG